MNTVMLLLADGRFPSGGHAHSSGLEAAVTAGRVTTLPTLESFLLGRLATSGLVTASFTAAAHAAATAGSAGGGSGIGEATRALAELDAELDARTAAPALRLASRRQGRALLRAGRTVWPHGSFALIPIHPDGPHQPITLGVTAAAAGLTIEETALTATYGCLTGPASAAVRLLGLDPYQVQVLLTRLAGACDAIAAEAAALAGKSPAELPAATAPLADISAEIHATWEVRLFAS